MQKAKLTITFHSYWHAGTGSGEGSNLDALVVKSPAGLPYLPGKSLKGLLREALQTAEDCGHLESGITERLFGTTPVMPPQKTRFETEAGSLFFENATLGKDMEAWAQQKHNRGKLSGLFAQLASTRIDDKGMAENNTLRKIEVAVPLELTGIVSTSETGDEWFAALLTAAPLVRGAGAHRTRGLGRMSLEVKKCEQ